MDDTELALRLARDLDGTFEALVRAHVDRCHAIALRVTGNPHDAEEIAQDALVRAYRALATYEPERIRELRLRPWLTTIVLNLCRNRARTRHVPSTPLAPLVEAGWEPAADAASDPSGRRARRRPSASASPRTSRRCRSATASRWCCATSTTCPTPSWPRSLGRPEGTLKAQVHRGLAMLRAAMAGTELEELTA